MRVGRVLEVGRLNGFGRFCRVQGNAGSSGLVELVFGRVGRIGRDPVSI